MPSSAIIIPPSETSVDVSIIDTKARSAQDSRSPFYCFLVHHKPSNTRLLFDLALRKDAVENSNTVPLESINGIVWSHHHWDHIGDPSTFPSTTSLIVGSGFKDEFLPAYPENPDSPLTQDAILGREVVEPDFKGADIIQIGGYAAVDYFKDGSFYFLDTPGHTIGHVSALARTTAGDDSTFMFLGGDVAHHAGEFRPSPFEPMPAEIRPDPRKPAFQSNGNGSLCPGSMFERMHRGALERSMDPRTTPFYQTTVQPFDANDNVFTAIAHDASLADVVDFFPNSANEWKAKGWKREGHWRFLSDFI
ncbi:hypothetical protein IWW34DRAFT_815496 [Fusarium oxysporum f. sp. albedinis]|nr:hypothetical protein IWW34DRAFT_815496 [Fusarium oxysporum f. sp. albedinis]